MIQDTCEQLGAEGSLLFCFIEYCNKDWSTLIRHFERLKELKILDNNGEIIEEQPFLKWFGCDKTIERIEEKDIKVSEKYITKFVNEDTGNFAYVITKGKNEVIYKSLEKYDAFDKGKPVEWLQLNCDFLKKFPRAGG